MAIPAPSQPCGCAPGPDNCLVTQILDPTDLTLVATSSGSVDPAMQENGEAPLGTGQSEVQVTFVAPKAGDYRFEYLYVDAFGIINPGTIKAVPTVQTKDGFTAELAGSPTLAGYILRWRVVVIQVAGQPPPAPEPPQSLYLQLPQADTFVVNWPVLRTTEDYGFTELRVEHLVAPPDDPLAPPVAVIFPMVIFKALNRFIVRFNTTPTDAFFYLAVRSP